MTHWYFVWWNLLVPEPLVHGLIDFIQSFYNIVTREEDCVPIDSTDDRHVLDYPGLCMAKRHLHRLQVDGLTVFIPSTDFQRMFVELNDLPLCYEGGIAHYRLYSTVRCLCLLPPQRELLLQEMGMQLNAAIEIADWENRRLNSAMGDEVIGLSISTEEGRRRLTVLAEPFDKGFIMKPRQVIDRDIEEV